MSQAVKGALLVLALAASAAGGWYAAQRGVGKDAGQASAKPPPSAPATSAVAVETTTVARVAFDRGINAVGSLLSDETVMLRPEVAGRIRDITFYEGQPVTQGQVLLRLDDQIARAELSQAQANLSLAQSQNHRAASLQAEGFISKQARDEAASKLKIERAAVALARARLDKTVITAPFAGVIGLRNVSVGDYVNAGQDLVQMEAINPLKADFRLPEQYLTQVRAGQRLDLRFDALPAERRTGEVYAISPLVDAGGRSILVRAKVPNDDGVLRPGMFARIQLLFAREEALVVPETALAPAGQVQYVYRITDGHAQRVEVQIGERREGRVEVQRGVNEGDQIVVAGLQRLSDGAAVTISASLR